jgi:hypothetical protein
VRSGINEATARSVVGVEECGQGDELAGALDGTIADELGLRRTGRLLSPHEVDEQADPRPCQRQQLPADFVHLPYPDPPAGRAGTKAVGVLADAVERVEAAVVEFVDYVARTNRAASCTRPGSRRTIPRGS